MSDYNIETDGNSIVINGELELLLWVDTPEAEGVEPDEYKWLDEGAFGLYDSDKETGVQVQMVLDE